MADWIGDADRWVVERVQTLHAAPLDHLFRWLSTLPVRLALLAVAALVVVGTVRSARPALAAALALGVGIALNALLTTVLKEAVDRPRPPVTNPEIHPLVAVPDSPSFPSGHASGAFAAAAALAAFVPRYRVALYGVAALVALSRVWLGVHYPTDVIAGALLGFAVGQVAGRVARARLGAAPGSDQIS